MMAASPVAADPSRTADPESRASHDPARQSRWAVVSRCDGETVAGHGGERHVAADRALSAKRVARRSGRG
ncbi:MAG: hypothetical protein DI544_09595 [Sphingomonas taxi]|uniref:Uncharacterized protein n=1 Tax=Sphingomonas taxi TaxID=1549858 RepID=A0A2W5QYV9_9SPHN|nr:MAG: hypothetical protein DI544_09595 [Sphingomonas taxi]